MGASTSGLAKKVAELEEELAQVVDNIIPTLERNWKGEINAILGPSVVAVCRMNKRKTTLSSLFSTVTCLRRDFKELQEGKGGGLANRALRHLMGELGLLSEHAIMEGLTRVRQPMETARGEMVVDVSPDLPDPPPQEPPQQAPRPPLPPPNVAPPLQPPPPTTNTPADPTTIELPDDEDDDMLTEDEVLDIQIAQEESREHARKLA